MFITPFVAALIFGGFGLLVELLFSCVYDIIKTRIFSLNSSVSLWMYPVYAGSFHLLSFIGPYLQRMPTYEIYFIIVICLYICEFSWSFIYEKFGIQPWCYHHAIRFRGVKYLLHVNHRITVLYAPFWFIFAYFIWEFYKIMVKLMIVWPLGVA